MVKSEKTTNDILEILKNLPEDKYNQLYDFALFLTYQMEKGNENRLYKYTNEPVNVKIAENEVDLISEGLSLEDIKDCFGLWKGRDITKESIRQKAWRNGK